MNYYILVKKEDVTQAMVNRSVARKIADLPTHIARGVWLGMFTFETEFCILEVTTENLNLTTVFDAYVWYEESEIKEFLRADRIANQES